MHESTWMLRQLARIAEREPDLVSRPLREMIERYPHLFESIILGAAEEDQVMIADAAAMLGLTMDETRRRVIDHRRRNGTQIDTAEGPNGARLRGSGVAVWEIAREYRRHGTLDELRSDFPAIPPQELEAALEYADDHREETDALIDKYESLFAQKTSFN